MIRKKGTGIIGIGTFTGTAIVVIAVVMLALASAPNAAAFYSGHGFFMLPSDGYNPTYGNGTWVNTTINGSVYYDGGHGLVSAKTSPYNQTFYIPEAADTIKFAHIYAYVWGGRRDYEGWVQVNFTNAAGTTDLGKLLINGTDDDNYNVWGSSCGAWVVWYNVTNLVTTGDNTASFRTGDQPTPGCFDGRVDNLHMIAVYENESMNETRVWVVQGHEALCHAYETWPDHDYGIAYFNGTIDKSEWKSGWLYTAFEAGGEDDPDTIHFNDHELCTDCADGSTYSPYMDLEVFCVYNNVTGPEHIDYLNAAGGQHVDWWRDGDDYQHDINVMLELSKEKAKPDLRVAEIADPVLPNHNFTLELVANQTYTINATIRNAFPIQANASNATLYVNGVQSGASKSVPSLGYGETAELQFDLWTPSEGKTYTLKVVADASGEVDEKNELNNATTKTVVVLDEGTQPDLLMNPNDLILLPTFGNNHTTVLVNVANNGTRNITTSFTVRMTAPGSTQNDVISASTANPLSAKGVKQTTFDYDAAYGGPYDVTVILDVNDDITNEVSEANNETSKDLNVVRVRILDSHHYGNTSDFSDPILTQGGTVQMFDVTKLVPKNCTTWDVLNSVADVKNHPSAAWKDNTYVYAIDGLQEKPSHPTEGSIYWYQYVNGIYLSLNQDCSLQKVDDGDTMHWDLHRDVQGNDVYTGESEGYTARLAMSWNDHYPEPMTHGFYNRTSDQREIWSTTIVYPSESTEYLEMAEEVNATLVSRGVPAGRISIETDSSVSSTQKETTNLILLGTFTENDLLAEINQYHQTFGMVVHYNTTSGKLIDEYANGDVNNWTEYDHGGVVQACDNPYDNLPLGTISHMDEGPMLFIASGTDDCWASHAAKLFVNDTDKIVRAWVIVPAINVTLNDNGTVTLDWSWCCDDFSAPSCGSCNCSSDFDIYITNNLTAGFPGTANDTVTGCTWLDENAASSDDRYYRVECQATGNSIEDPPNKLNYTLRNIPGEGNANWISLPGVNSAITNARGLIDAIPNCDGVYWRNSTSQEMEAYIKLPYPPFYSGTNFEVVSQREYEAHVTTDTVWTVVGWTPAIWQILLRNVPGEGNANWIGLPFDTTIGNARELIDDIPNCDGVYWRNSTSQEMEAYIKLPYPPFYSGTNFVTKPKRGYEVHVTTDTKWMPR